MRLKIAFAIVLIVRLSPLPAQNSDILLTRVKSNEEESSWIIDQATLDAWSAPYRGWQYFPEPVIPSDWFC
jgi:hypothetical protein